MTIFSTNQLQEALDAQVATIDAETARKMEMMDSGRQTRFTPDEDPVISARRSQDVENNEFGADQLQQIVDTFELHQTDNGGKEGAAELVADHIRGQVDGEFVSDLQGKGIDGRQMGQLADNAVEQAQGIARSELGDEAYGHLSEIANSNAQVRGILIDYHQKRALGQANVPYAEVYKLCCNAV